MSEYIEREAAIDTLCRHIIPNRSRYIKEIEAIPAADVVEVVRCKDCKHAIQRSEEQIAHGCSPLFCDNFIFGAYPEFFCMDGERKGVTP